MILPGEKIVSVLSVSKLFFMRFVSEVNAKQI
jgi:hypothetical protein